MFMVGIGINACYYSVNREYFSECSRTSIRHKLGNSWSKLLEPIPARRARAYLPASGFEHPASTLSTRFPAALGIGHGPACGLANACALVYVAA